VLEQAGRCLVTQIMKMEILDLRTTHGTNVRFLNCFGCKTRKYLTIDAAGQGG